MTEDKMPDRSAQYLANERTFLAWLRTCVALIGLGFVVSRFGLGIRVKGNIIADASIHSHSSLLGISMVVLGAVLIIYALKNYLETDKAVQRGIYKPKLRRLCFNDRLGDFHYSFLPIFIIVTTIPRKKKSLK